MIPGGDVRLGRFTCGSSLTEEQRVERRAIASAFGGSVVDVRWLLIFLAHGGDET